MSNVPRLNDYSHLNVTGDVTNFLELRMENDASGNPIYVGYNNSPDAGEDIESWFIIKITYDVNSSPTHQQLPLRGVGFKYAWSDRANIF